MDVLSLKSWREEPSSSEWALGLFSSQVTTASTLTSLGLLFFFRLFITQASLFSVVLVPACSFLESFFKVQFTYTKVPAFPSDDVNSKKLETQQMNLRQHVLARAS